MGKSNLSKHKKLFLLSIMCMLLLVSCSIKSFESIDSTINRLQTLDYRVTNSKGNYQLADELKKYLKTLENEKTKLLTHEYKVNIPKNYNLTFTYEDNCLSLSTTNSILISVNEKEIDTKKVVLVNSLDKIKNDKKYAFIAYSWDDVNKAKLYSNISIIIFAEDVDNKKNIIEIKNNSPTFIIVNKSLTEKLSTFINQEVSLELNLDFEDIFLENIYMTYEGKNSKDAIVLTAHYDATGSTNGIFSKGIVDNGSGVAIVLDLIRKTTKDNLNSNMDIIFSFVNSEEQMYLNIPGSKFFNQFLKENYENILNINLDSLGEKDVNTIYYGISGNVNNDLLINYVQNSFPDTFTLEEVDYYPSDNVNFNNSVFFYNFNWSNNNILHTEKDNIESINIDKLENISEGLMQFLLSLSKMEMKDILRIDNTVSNCIVKEKDYINDLNFGQYVFYECGDEPNKIHFFIQDRYQEMVKDLEDISKDLSKNLFDKDSIYNVTFNFELPGIEYKDQMLEQIYNYFNEVPDLKFLISEYPISLFRLSNLDENTYEIKYTFSAQRYPLEYIALIEYFQQDFAKMKDLTVGQDNKTDIYIGYENNIKVMKSILEDSEYFYLLNFFIYGDDLLSLPLDDLTKIFKDGTKDVLSMIK